MQLLFYSAGAVALIATVLAITRANAVHALLYLISSLLAVALVMMSVGAPFAAALEILVYAGAIMVLFVFVVMLLNLGPGGEHLERAWLVPRYWFGPGALAAALLAELTAGLARGVPGLSGQAEVGVKQVGIALFGPYLLAVELGSMLLLAGLVAAYHIGRRDTQRGAHNHERNREHGR